MNTNTEIIVKAETAIHQAYTSAVSRYIPGATKTQITAFCAWVTNLSLYSLCMTEHLLKVTDNVFADPVIRDFTMSLSANFHVRFAEEGEQYKALIDILAKGMCQAPGNDVDTLIPDVLSRRLPTVEDVTQLLGTEKWLVSLVLLSLFIPFSSS
jgi:hypothetical protein